MITLANLIRKAFKNGNVSTVISIRGIVSWIRNTKIFGDCKTGFKTAYLNKCDAQDKNNIHEMYQRVFNEEL